MKFIETLSELLVGQSMTFKSENGVVVNAEISTSQSGITDVKVNCKLENRTVSLFLYLALSKNAIDFGEELNSKILELKSAFDAELKELKELAKKQAAEEQAKLEAARAAQKQKEKEAKAEAKRLAQVSAAKNMVNHHVVLSNDLYTTLGWLAKHVGSVSAQVPDFLENWFTRVFPDQTYTLCDSTAKTSGGYSMKWGLSLSASLKNIEDGVPSLIKQHTNEAGNKITDTQFVFDLVYKFGFNFGKTQNLDNIMDEIPVDKLSQFNAGLAC